MNTDNILLLATLEPCWLWWLLLSLLAFLLGALLGWLLFGNRKRLKELEEENAGLKAKLTNMEKDYVSLKYQYDESQKDITALRSSLNRCQADKAVLDTKLKRLKAEQEEGDDEQSSSGSGPGLTAKAAAPALGGFAAGFAFSDVFPDDDLKIIEGIGPKIEDLLKAAGIGTWSALAAANTDQLSKVLSDAGPRYQVHDPENWPPQAALAAKGDWDGLIKLQKSLGAGSSSGGAESPSKVEKLAMKTLGFSSNPEDLKVIEGIGPKIEELLKAAGIQTWQGLAQAQVDKLRSILADAGDNFRLANPETWPQQAALAAAGKWGELKSLQDRLQGGKNTK